MRVAEDMPTRCVHYVHLVHRVYQRTAFRDARNGNPSCRRTLAA